ncbi:ethylene-responsive transcription factor ERF017 [Lactuca sativa]|uniref:ethylene-responsive transcription factor ERF017 n=1 Tax=Lactuca sativa TaxID=4236 RepID=UPI0022AEFDF7|nr:ethylene-responsive transcription factor ERF017 [Lactuca sativa]
MVKPSSSSPSAISATANNERDRTQEAKYRGVRKRKWGKWVSEIRLPNSRERIWLGSYDSPEKAARAFDAALFCLRGNTANFNFPHQPPDIPGGTELHPSQIPAVAATFANSIPSSSLSSSSSSSQLQDSSSDQHPFFSGNCQQTCTSMDVVSSSSFDMDYNTDSVPDFGIFPGFDDYFMPMQPPLAAHDYGDEVFDGVYSQDPSYLWSF